MKRSLVAFLVGFLFAVGLGISGMTQPQKIIGFLDPWSWDPSLLLVMMGAVGIHAVIYRISRKRRAPLFDSQWHVPTRNDITPNLIAGATIFGLGWGLAGYCPGPALVSLVSGQSKPWIFVFAMLAGMQLFIKAEKWLHTRQTTREKRWKSQATLQAP